MMQPSKTPLILLLLAGIALPAGASAQQYAPRSAPHANHFSTQSGYQGANQLTAQHMQIAPELQSGQRYRLAPAQMARPAPRHIQPQMQMRAPQMRPLIVPAQSRPLPRPLPRQMRASMRPQYHMTAQPHAAGRYSPQAPRRAGPQKKKSGFLSRLLNKGDDKYMYANYRDRINGAHLPQYQVAPRAPHPMDQFARWQNSEAEYALYPGDQIDIVVASAPELSRTLTVGPDGRVVMPMTKPVMAAGRSMKALEAALSAQLAKQLVDPGVAVTPRAYSAQQVFVGGQVGAQGTYTLPGPVGVMEAVLMAGGFATSAQLRQVVVLRRNDAGAFMARTIDFRGGLQNPLSLADNIQLRRGDIIFVPRSDISEIGLFMQQYVRDALPVGLNLSYNLGEGTNN